VKSTSTCRRLAQGGEGAAQAHVGTRGAGGIGQDAGQYRPQDGAAARHIGRGQARRGQLGDLRAVRQAQAHAVTGRAFAQEGVEHPSCFKARSVAGPRLMPAP
jgi:hypothetical protein